ncbi:Type II secretion system protein E [compost metagenome]
MAVSGKRMRLGEILIQAGVLTDEQLQIGLAKQQQTRDPIGQILVNLGYVTEEQIKHALEVQYGVKSFSLKSRIPQEVLRLIPEAMMRRHKILPVSLNQLTIAMVDPSNILALDDLRLRFKGVSIQPVVVTEAEFDQALKAMPREALLEQASREEDAETDPPQDESSAEKIAQAILTGALRRGATEIVLEPREHDVMVRFRIEGRLVKEPLIPSRLANALVARLRILADLPPTASPTSQSGVIRMPYEARPIKIVLSCMPVRHGQMLTLRIFDPAQFHQAVVDALVLHPQTASTLKALLERPAGLLLFNAPRHSGKQTMIAACLREVLRAGRSAIALDLPVAESLEGVTQVTPSEQNGEARRAAVEAMLLQSADLMVVDPIEDPEVVRKLVRGALGGRLALVGLTTTQRFLDELLDLSGMEARAIANAVAGVVTMRLVRRLCTACRIPYEPDEAKIAYFRPYDDSGLLYRAVGCPDCHDTGYKGQVGLYEVVPMSAKIRQLVAQGASKVEIDALAKQQGVLPLADYAAWAVAQGHTTLEELARSDLFDGAVV